MRIRKLDTDRSRDVEQFVSFPFELYRDCPQWVPPLVGGTRDALNRRKHPFYRHSTADFFVAESDGQTLGRIAVMDNRSHNAYRGAEVAFFGFFDAVEDVEVARALFSVAFEWAHGRHLQEIIGPRGLIGTDGGGVLVEGFAHRPALGVPYNLPYYDAFIQDSGFAKDTDHLSGYFPGDFQLPERFHAIAEKLAQRRGLWVKAFRTRREMRRWAPRVIEVHREAFTRTHTYYPPTEAEMAVIVDTLVGVADPRLVKLAMKGDQVIGFAFAYPDVSAALQKTRGRLWPLGWYHLLQERRRTCWVNANGIGVLPEYQGLGPSILLYAALDESIKALRFKHVDVVQVDEKNLGSRSIMETLGVTWYKRHRNYRRGL